MNRQSCCRSLIALLVLLPLTACVEAAPVDPVALRLAIVDLTTTFGDAYAQGNAYQARLEEVVSKGDEAGLRALAEEALLANPLLDFDRLLIIKRGEGQLGLSQNWESNSTLPKNGYDNEIAVLSPLRPDGTITPLYRPEQGRFVGDVDLHFDADRLLFSMPGQNGRWQVHEINIDGSGLRQFPLIEEPDLDNYDACYLPDDSLIFCSTAPFVGVPCVTGSSHVCNLYRYEKDSGSIRRLTFEQDHDWCPTVLGNGRILYLRWEYSDIPHFASRILFHMNPDGTQQMEYYGSNSYWPNAMFYARPIPGSPSQFVAVVGGHHDLPRMGELVLFDTARSRYEADGAIQRIPGRGKKVEPILLDGLTTNSWPKFLHPFPLSAKYFLVSCKPTPDSRWGIYLVDVFDNMTLIKELDGYALFEPLPLRKTPRPPIIPNTVKPEQKDATVYLADIYAGDGLKDVPRGAVKQLRVFTYQFAYYNMGGQINRVGLDGPWDVKRIIGTVPVEPDGSAFFRVPANTPISIQPLDEEGQALQWMRSWMTAMPGENLSCVGCHERQNSGPPAKYATAVRRAPSDITPWYGPVRGFSFNREVQPVLDHYCVRCHDGQNAARPDFRLRPDEHPQAADKGYNEGTHFPPAYYALRRHVRGGTMESDLHLLPPGEFHADTAPVVQMLKKGHHDVRLDLEAWDRLFTWIDLNTPAHGTWRENVGDALVIPQRDRRQELLKRYAGLDDDPEAIFPVSYTPPREAAPSPEPAPDTGTAPTATGGTFDAATAVQRQQAAGPVERTVDLGGGVSLSLVHIPSGEFVMGQQDGLPDEQPVARVVIDQPFWIGQCEITNEQYLRFDPAHDSRIEHGDFLQFSEAERGHSLNGPTQPVAHVSWENAMAFCNWLSAQTGETFTLPSEAQWEYACRAGTDTPLCYGAPDVDFTARANLADASLRVIESHAPWNLPIGAIPPWRPVVESVNDRNRVSAPVKSYAANPWGLFDMHGNAAEWTRSAYRPYPYAPDDGREDPKAPGKKVARGGSWYDRPERARSAFRSAYYPWLPVYNVGFRVICTHP